MTHTNPQPGRTLHTNDGFPTVLDAMFDPDHVEIEDFATLLRPEIAMTFNNRGYPALDEHNDKALRVYLAHRRDPSIPYPPKGAHPHARVRTIITAMVAFTNENHGCYYETAVSMSLDVRTWRIWPSDQMALPAGLPSEEALKSITNTLLRCYDGLVTRNLLSVTPGAPFWAMANQLAAEPSRGTFVYTQIAL